MNPQRLKASRVSSPLPEVCFSAFQKKVYVPSSQHGGKPTATFVKSPVTYSCQSHHEQRDGSLFVLKALKSGSALILLGGDGW